MDAMRSEMRREEERIRAEAAAAAEAFKAARAAERADEEARLDVSFTMFVLCLCACVQVGCDV